MENRIYIFLPEDEEHDVLSPWHKEEGQTSMLQYILMRKATMFGGIDIVNVAIANANSPNPRVFNEPVERLGFFDRDRWDEEKYKIAVEAILTKANDENFRQALLSTGNSEIVFATPYDRIWGVGFGKADAISIDASKWGENLWGKALMEVRRQINNRFNNK